MADQALSNEQQRLRHLVEEYCNIQRNPSLPKFTFHGPFKMPADLSGSDAEKPGCYVIYRRNNQSPYIGMSLSGIGYRIRSHFSAATQKSAYWDKGPAHFFEIVPVFNTWEAPSLEQYLIEHARISDLGPGFPQ
jgi:hypothetical protein